MFRRDKKQNGFFYNHVSHSHQVQMPTICS